MAQAFIAKVVKIPNLKKLHLFTHSDYQSNNEKIKVHSFDFSSNTKVNLVKEAIAGESITHFIQFHGYAYSEDNIQKISSKDFNDTLEINLTSVISILKAILPNMESQSYGRIVLMSTASAVHGGGKNSFSYGLAKHGVLYLVKHLSKYYTNKNILTNSVSPGFIRSKFHTQVLKKTEAEMEERAKSVRLGRIGNPEDVARVIYNLAFENDFVTGENIKIDGGDFI
ncbi:oxidoreductase, short chain dehydrogenase/reductase family protein [Leptospira vanthielii serovar Holland str. Waz Holland = ATCC 700522]|uniref:Oxidoreductase, short chain dehydrogenase/reductase family protein n=1 Tax=Leptospira vanthielii serovar Holland str. Waz Holland = ATCC 700522 TaxID=1218591 RepID=N1WCP5_9LEPT|nr:oxidoreductase, short chain dehydrogenase/reductase family protein [Leptospira vanthielii serovar Holland str. Waz Holland = ATCC 700522]